ncbi:MAG: hypothetical protein OXJ52_08270 [Oligoflexia bacterium]|nr:hypothetical protein [Oligoflexia bacterium]
MMLTKKENKLCKLFDNNRLLEKKVSGLKPFLKTIEAGLHLSLTEPKPIYST